MFDTVYMYVCGLKYELYVLSCIFNINNNY